MVQKKDKKLIKLVYFLPSLFSEPIIMADNTKYIQNKFLFVSGEKTLKKMSVKTIIPLVTKKIRCVFFIIF
jgi:hypothetical protein